MSKAILVISDMPSRCGDCHLCYKDNFDTDGEHYKYCPNCGQRLDWSEVENYE